NRGVPDPRFILRVSPDTDRPQFRTAYRFDFRPDHLHSLRRIDDRAFVVPRRSDRAVLAKLWTDSDRAWHFPGWPIRRRLCVVPEAGWRKCRLASGMGGLRAACLR